jgi:hypothetical protein
METKDIKIGNIVINVNSATGITWEIEEDDIEIMKANPENYKLIEVKSKSEEFEKTSKEYAEQLANDFEVNQGAYSKTWNEGFLIGYTKAVEETEVERLLKSLMYAKSIIDKLEENHPEIAHKLMGLDEMMEMEDVINKFKK